MDFALAISAIGLGFASGFHCIGMCGPIALSMGLTKQQQTNFYLQNLTYQFGRILTYTVLGAILGIIGEGFEMAGFQQVLTISVGIMLIIMALFSFGGKDFCFRIPFINNALLKVKINLGKLLPESRLQISLYNRLTKRSFTMWYGLYGTYSFTGCWWCMAGCCFYGNFRTWYFSIYVCRCTSRKLNEPGFENKSFKSYSYRYDYPWWAFYSSWYGNRYSLPFSCFRGYGNLQRCSKLPYSGTQL